MISYLNLSISTDLHIDQDKLTTFRVIAQSMLDRLCVGELRYGKATRRQKYFSRMKKELKAYELSGNAEQLINIANYCILEWIAPEHPKHHFDPNAESVTRKKGE